MPGVRGSRFPDSFLRERQQIASDHQEYADKLALRADSILVSLDDEEFNEGVRSVRAKPSGPIVEPIDFVVFGKRP